MKTNKIHHIAIAIHNIEEAALKSCREQKVTLVDQKPELGSQHTKIAFIHPKSMGNFLVEF